MTLALFRKILAATLVATFAVAMPPAVADTSTPAAPALPTVTLSAEARHRAPNDLGVASVYAEVDGNDPAVVAKSVNDAIDAALAAARRVTDVKVRSGNTATHPIYAKNGRRIEGWRMRSELQLESRNAAALSTLLGRLQGSLAVGTLHFRPAPETRAAAADQAATDALRAFEARAKTISGALGKRYRIRDLAVGYGGQPPVMPIMRSAAMPAMSAEMAPMPVEAGESEVVVTIDGTIELLD